MRTSCRCSAGSALATDQPRRASRTSGPRTHAGCQGAIRDAPEGALPTRAAAFPDRRGSGACNTRLNRRVSSSPSFTAARSCFFISAISARRSCRAADTSTRTNPRGIAKSATRGSRAQGPTVFAAASRERYSRERPPSPIVAIRAIASSYNIRMKRRASASRDAALSSS